MAATYRADSDEATSALDNRAQEIVSKSLERRKVTRLVIAHRLSTIRSADRICVMDHTPGSLTADTATRTDRSHFPLVD